MPHLEDLAAQKRKADALALARITDNPVGAYTDGLITKEAAIEIMRKQLRDLRGELEEYETQLAECQDGIDALEYGIQLLEKVENYTPPPKEQLALPL